MLYLEQLPEYFQPSELLDRLQLESSVLRLVGEMRYDIKKKIKHMLTDSRLLIAEVKYVQSKACKKPTAEPASDCITEVRIYVNQTVLNNQYVF